MMSLKHIDRELNEFFDSLGVELTDEMYQLYLTTGEVNFNSKYWLEATTAATVTGIVKSTELALSGSEFTISNVDELQEYYLTSPYKGSTLSSSLRGAAKDASKIMQTTVHDHLKTKTTFTRLAEALTKKNVSKGDLPSHLVELNKQAKIVIGNPSATAKEKAKLDAMLKKSKAEIEKLSKNNAPTKQLKAAYDKVINAVEKGSEKALQKQMEYAMKRKVEYNNKRIARTELARAHSEAFQRKILKDKGVETVRILLDAKHNIKDECDMLAGADLYGLGKGVYPKAKAPMPPYHPHCICSALESAKSAKGARFSNERAEEYLKKLPNYKRKAMLQGGKVKDWREDLKGYDGELTDKPKALPERLVKKG